jgi:hypothetical protein
MADIVNILTLVLKAMVSVECLIKLSGDDKKRFVITLLEKQLPNYDEYREIVPMIIELVIILSKTKIPINIKKLEMCCNLQ